VDAGNGDRGYLIALGPIFRTTSGPQGAQVNEPGTTTRRRVRASNGLAHASANAAPDENEALTRLLAAMQDVVAGDFSVQLPLH